ncbi:MAG TPA: GntG family PLP-dependent aldolase [Polyangiaceae bacterium]
MRKAMAEAEVGDDVYGEDPTVRALEEEAAKITGKEDALFVPSGTMSNQLAIRCHVQPGDEIVAGFGTHSYWFESGGVPVLSGAQFAIVGTTGLFTAEEMESAIKPSAHWFPRSSLVCVENTHNLAGGRIFPQDDVDRIVERAHARGLKAHLDGARIWNASVATGLDVARLAKGFDTVSVCFSKGLGAPVGSALCGPTALVRGQATRLRKMWGGGMRQVGILAAGALHALAHHRTRLADDHANAKRFGELAGAITGVSIVPVETNIVNVDVPIAAQAVADALKAKGVLINPAGPKRLRAVLHLDVQASDVDAAAKALAEVVKSA